MIQGFPIYLENFPDVPLMNLCALGFSECELSKYCVTKFDFKKMFKMIRENIPQSILQKTLLSFNLRYRRVINNKGDRTRC